MTSEQIELPSPLREALEEIADAHAKADVLPRQCDYCEKMIYHNGLIETDGRWLCHPCAVAEVKRLTVLVEYLQDELAKVRK